MEKRIQGDLWTVKEEKVTLAPVEEVEEARVWDPVTDSKNYADL